MDDGPRMDLGAEPPDQLEAQQGLGAGQLEGHQGHQDQGASHMVAIRRLIEDAARTTQPITAMLQVTFKADVGGDRAPGVLNRDKTTVRQNLLQEFEDLLKERCPAYSRVRNTHYFTTKGDEPDQAKAVALKLVVDSLNTRWEQRIEQRTEFNGVTDVTSASVNFLLSRPLVYDPDLATAQTGSN